jgi:hypothetical protein
VEKDNQIAAFFFFLTNEPTEELPVILKREAREKHKCILASRTKQEPRSQQLQSIHRPSSREERQERTSYLQGEARQVPGTCSCSGSCRHLTNPHKSQ